MIQAKLTCKQKTAKETPPGGIPQGVVAWDVEVTNQANEPVAVYTILTPVRRLAEVTASLNGGEWGTQAPRRRAIRPGGGEQGTRPASRERRLATGLGSHRRFASVSRCPSAGQSPTPSRRSSPPAPRAPSPA